MALAANITITPAFASIQPYGTQTFNVGLDGYLASGLSLVVNLAATLGLLNQTTLAFTGNGSTTPAALPVMLTVPVTGTGYLTGVHVEAGATQALNDFPAVLLAVVGTGTIGFNVASFQAQFPAFANTSPALLETYFSFATNYISTATGPLCGINSLNVTQQTFALNLMTAHIAQLMANAAAGTPNGFITGETVKDVSFTVKEPPGESQFQWWLNLTPYGSQLYTLLSVNSAGGFYFGGQPETLAFRRFGGFIGL